MAHAVIFKRIAWTAMAAACLTAGCIPVYEEPVPYVEVNPYEDVPGYSDLPINPPGAGGQMWYFGFKSYDNSYRIRWPTYFATVMGLGPGSYTLVEGQLAEFRSFDTDGGQKRPSYSIDGPQSRFNGTVRCILYSMDGQAVGWFEVNADGTSQGTLP